ncbi:MAG: glycosyltransferase family 4 protein [Thermodesulfobacteriota bacterium]
MRVLMLTTSYPRHSGDFAGIFVHELARHLVRSGVEVMVAAPHHTGAAAAERREGVEVRRFRYMWPEYRQTLCYGYGLPENLKAAPGRKLLLPPLLAAFLAQAFRHGRRADLFHAHWTLAGLAALAAGRMLGKPVILNLHHGQLGGWFGSLNRVVVEKSDLVLCNSRFNQGLLLPVARPKACEVVPPGIDVYKFRPAAGFVRPPEIEAFASPGTPLVLAVGRLIELKGYDYLLEGLALVEHEPPPRLVIVGDGPRKADLIQKARALNLADRVLFTGLVPPDRTPLFFRAADVFVHPAVVDRQGGTEGLGMTVLEAMACGVPCVGSRVGGIQETIQDRRTGYLVEQKNPAALAEKITILLKDRDLRARMSMEARRFLVEHYSWEAIARTTLDHYRRLAG